MFVVEKSTRKQEPKILEDEHEEILIEFYKKLTQLHQDKKQQLFHQYRTIKLSKQELKVLEDLRTRQVWIGCRCQLHNGKIPLLFPYKLSNGTGYSLKRMRLEIQHNNNCFFSRKQEIIFSPNQKEDDSEVEKVAKQRATLEPLGEHENLIIDRLDEQPVTKSTSEREFNIPINSEEELEERRSTLAKILFTLLKEAHLHLLDKIDRDKDVTEQYRRIKDTTKRTIVKGISLSDYLCTHPKSIPYFCEKLERDKKKFNNPWPNKVRPQGFFIGIADEVIEANNQLQFKSLEPPGIINTEVTPKCFKPKHSQVSKPYWVIANIAESRVNPGKYTLRETYAHPVYSKTMLIPVDSNYERRTLKILINLQKLIFESYNILIKIEKPLHNVKTIDNENCRPDFVLYEDVFAEISGKNVIIETMGFNDREYLDRKDRTHQHMKKLGELIEHIGWAQTPKKEQEFIEKVIGAINLQFNLNLDIKMLSENLLTKIFSN